MRDGKTEYSNLPVDAVKLCCCFADETVVEANSEARRLENVMGVQSRTDEGYEWGRTGGSVEFIATADFKR